MAYVKVTDGAVIRFYNTSNRASNARYNELINNNTGYNVVVDEANHPKEFTEEQVKTTIEAAQTAANKKPRKATVANNRAVKDED